MNVLLGSNRLAEVSRWQFPAENGVIEILDVFVQAWPLREMLSQAARLGKVYLKNLVLVLGEVAPQNRGVDGVVGASY
ncbi:hypothetical protein D9M71_805270 [compost metagenome]